MRAETDEGSRSAAGDPSRRTLAGLKSRWRMSCEWSSSSPMHAWHSNSKRRVPEMGFRSHFP